MTQPIATMPHGNVDQDSHPAGEEPNCVPEPPPNYHTIIEPLSDWQVVNIGQLWRFREVPFSSSRRDL